MLTIADVVRHLESIAPLRRAAEWDNVGLLLGSSTAKVERILTCLTVTPEVAAEAVQWRANLIVSHHPILFRPVKQLTDATSEGRLLLELIRADVAVFSAHTAFDDCAGGINDQLAQKLDLSDVRPLRPWSSEPKCKLVVFVPDQDLVRVSDAIFAAGAGIIGQYSQCSFRLTGTGTFFGSDAANPTVGEKGRREEVSEWRLEAVCPQSLAANVVAAMRKAHSYEEPAYDLYPLAAEASSLGNGRMGRLKEPATLQSLAGKVRAALACGPVQLIGEAGRTVHQVAVACGAAASFLDDAIRSKADVFFTGEARFHDYLRAQASGIAMILPGHYATERLGVEQLAIQLARQWPGVEARASQRDADPVRWI